MVVLRCKVVMAGDAESGKTALAQMFQSNGKSFPKNYLATSAVDLSVKVVNIPDSDTAVELYIHDTAGSEWSGGAVCLLVYDVTNAQSFASCAKWVELLADSFGHRKLKGALVGCKADLADAVAVNPNQARDFASEHGLQHFECSAFENKDVDAPFNYLADLFHRSFEAKIHAIDA